MGLPVLITCPPSVWREMLGLRLMLIAMVALSQCGESEVVRLEGSRAGAAIPSSAISSRDRRNVGDVTHNFNQILAGWRELLPEAVGCFAAVTGFGKLLFSYQ